jgi:hypothetical protein
VTFEGTTEMGNPFMARRSFIPQDIWWGYQFANIVRAPLPGETHYTVDLDRQASAGPSGPHVHPSSPHVPMQWRWC